RAEAGRNLPVCADEGRVELAGDYPGGHRRGQGARPRRRAPVQAVLRACLMIAADLYRQLDGIIGRLRPDPGRDLHYIDYAHRVGRVFYHGTVSDLDGPVRSTWTYEED